MTMSCWYLQEALASAPTAKELAGPWAALTALIAGLASMGGALVRREWNSAARLRSALEQDIKILNDLQPGSDAHRLMLEHVRRQVVELSKISVLNNPVAVPPTVLDGSLGATDQPRRQIRGGRLAILIVALIGLVGALATVYYLVPNGAQVLTYIGYALGGLYALAFVSSLRSAFRGESEHAAREYVENELRNDPQYHSAKGSSAPGTATDHARGVGLSQD